MYKLLKVPNTCTTTTTQGTPKELLLQQMMSLCDTPAPHVPIMLVTEEKAYKKLVTEEKAYKKLVLHKKYINDMTCPKQADNP